MRKLPYTKTQTRGTREAALEGMARGLGWGDGAEERAVDGKECPREKEPHRTLL